MTEPNVDIWRLQAQRDIRGLIEALRQADPDIRKRAATALRALGASSAIPALQAALVNENHAQVRGILIDTLDVLFQQTLDEEDDDGAETHPVVRLIAQLSSDKQELVIRAAQNLGELQEKLAVEALFMVFNNPKHSARIRLAAAEALLKLESAPLEVSLLGVLRHADWRVRRNASAVLGQLEADWAVEPLAKMLQDPNEVVRRTALAALKHIGTEEALRAIEPSAFQTESAAKPTPQPSTPPENPTPLPADSAPLVPATSPEPVKPPSADPFLTAPGPDEEDTQPTQPILSDDVS